MRPNKKASSEREAAVWLTFNLNVSDGCLPSLTLIVGRFSPPCHAHANKAR
jgi:hypothetical protein